ncbi:hypothetical protein MASR2M78_17970 [Treponema sp.]
MSSFTAKYRLWPFLLGLLFTLASTEAIRAEALGRPFSVGLASGSPSGLWLAYDVAPSWGFQGLMAWDLVSPGGPTLSLDALRYLGTDPTTLSVFPSRRFSPYLGLGLKATFLVGDGRYGLSAARSGYTLRLPLGLRWSIGYSAFEALVELGPGLRLYPESDFELDAVLGLRYRF